MYNEQRKEQYIKERKEKAILSINTEKAFELAEPIEKEYGKKNMDEICVNGTVRKFLISIDIIILPVYSH